MVVSEGLAGGSRSGGSFASSSEVGQLIGSFLGVVHHVLGNGACKERC